MKTIPTQDLCCSAAAQVLEGGLLGLTNALYQVKPILTRDPGNQEALGILALIPPAALSFKEFGLAYQALKLLVEHPHQDVVLYEDVSLHQDALDCLLELARIAAHNRAYGSSLQALKLLVEHMPSEAPVSSSDKKVIDTATRYLLWLGGLAFNEGCLGITIYAFAAYYTTVPSRAIADDLRNLSQVVLKYGEFEMAKDALSILLPERKATVLLFEVIERAIEAKKFATAYTVSIELLKHFPGHPIALKYLHDTGLAAYQSDALEISECAFRAVFEHDPKHPAAINGLRAIGGSSFSHALQIEEHSNANEEVRSENALTYFPSNE